MQEQPINNQDYSILFSKPNLCLKTSKSNCTLPYDIKVIPDAENQMFHIQVIMQIDRSPKESKND